MPTDTYEALDASNFSKFLVTATFIKAALARKLFICREKMYLRVPF
jgi:hypothetical protein